MLTKNEIKHIKFLQQKKYREEHAEFIVEGKKSVNELLNSEIELVQLYAVDTAEYPDANQISNKDLARISSLKNPNNVLAVAKQPNRELKYDELKNELTVVLCDINNPGNLGTIIRACDWFGIKNIICSQNSVDLFNPKTIQSAMGSLFRVKVHYTDISEFLANEELKETTIYSAEIEGENLYSANKDSKGIIIFGNESNGVDKEISQLADIKLTIPRFNDTTESLNLSMAVGITLSEFKRN